MTLRIGHLSTLYHTALVIEHWGLLEKAGVEVEWQLFGGGPGIVEAMARGDVDIGYIGLPPAMIGIAKGVPIKCVAGGHIEGTVLCTNGSESTHTVASIISGLEGLKIGSPPRGSIHDILIRHLLEKQGVKAEVVNYPWADFIPLAMEKREVSAAVGTPALAVYLKRTLGASIALPPNRIWPFNPSYGILVKEELLNSQELSSFLRVHEKSCNLLLTDPITAAQAVSDVLGLGDPEFALETIRLSPRYCSALPPEYIEATLDFIPVMQELGYLSKPLSKDQIFDTHLIKKTHPADHHYNKPLKI